MELKNITLHQTHINQGAKMVPFAGFNMPVQYSGLTPEHHAVRTEVGVFDVSHMGEFYVRGPQALDLIQRVTTNDAGKLSPGKIQYSCFPNGKGGIVDDLLVYCITPEEYLLVVNGSNIDKDWAWIVSQNTFDCRLENKSSEMSLLAVQGPKAVEVLQKHTSVNLSEIAYYNFVIDTFCGVENVIISATGYTGSGGFELYMPNNAAAKIWQMLMDAGVTPCGLGARDTLRLEMGFCLYGNDIDDTTSPMEAGLGWITKFTKDFVDSETFKAQKENGVGRKLVGIEMIDRGIPRHDYPIADAEGNAIGKVTSGTMSPSLGKAIGMAYVPTALAAVGSEVFVEVRGKLLKAVVVKTPFLQK